MMKNQYRLIGKSNSTYGGAKVVLVNRSDEAGSAVHMKKYLIKTL